MAEAVKVPICSRPGCDQPGTKQCSACKTKAYCGPICQTTDWPSHKEHCPGHLRKVGMAHLQKANAFNQDTDWEQTLRYGELALVKLKQLNDRPIEAIDQALHCKFNALNYMGQHRKAMECAKECYCLYLTNHTHPPAIMAGFDLIESCIHNGEFADAHLYASTTWETITLSRDSHIPDDRLQWFTATGAYFLAKATINLARSGGIPPKELQASGKEAIALARRALEIKSQLHGPNDGQVAHVVRLLADTLDFFNNVDSDESIRLYERSIAIQAREEGRLSVNVGVGEKNLAYAYQQRAERACIANDVDRELTNLELALPHYREAARVYRAIDFEERADIAAHCADRVEETLRRLRIAKAAAAAATTKG